MPIFSSTSQDGASGSRSFLSRMSGTLRSTSKRNIHDFHVHLDEPHRDYAAGDEIKGKVVLVITKSVAITHIVLALHGRVRVAMKDNEMVNDDASFECPVGDSDLRFHGRGMLTLFRQEKVLGGEGLLKEPGQYESAFAMKLPSPEGSQPGCGLPSSIMVDKGFIIYDLVATLTRPTTPPTLTASVKLSVIERIDIGKLRPHQGVAYTVNPNITTKRRRNRPERAQMPREGPPLEPQSDAESGTKSAVSEDAEQDQPAARPPPDQNDARSNISVDSNTSEVAHPRSEPFSNYAALFRGLTDAERERVDQQTVEIGVLPSVSGLLPGDMLTVTVVVRHHSQVKSIHGIIATLYRRCAINPNPQLQNHEYPRRPRVAMRGLNISSHSKMVFRKDLCQAIAPLYLVGDVRSTEVKLSLRVPEDAFPTIRSVPGDMVNFTYQIEVIVDLLGKLGPQLQSTNSTARPGGFRNTTAGSTAARPAAVLWSPNIIDVERFSKSDYPQITPVEVTVGLLDSKRGIALHETSPFAQSHGSPSTQPLHANGDSLRNNQDSNVNGVHQQTQSHSQLDGFERLAVDTNGTLPPDQSHSHSEAPAYVTPAPALPDLSQMSEKDQVRHHEQRLLPSQPPQPPSQEAGPLRSPPPVIEPSIPPTLVPGTPAVPTYQSRRPEMSEPSAPSPDQVSAPVNAGTDAGEDKQELERRRLLADASAPPEFPEDCVAGPSSSAPLPSAPAASEPTAPVLTEEDEYDMISGPSRMGRSEPLPKYERYDGNEDRER